GGCVCLSEHVVWGGDCPRWAGWWGVGGWRGVHGDRGGEGPETPPERGKGLTTHRTAVAIFVSSGTATPSPSAKDCKASLTSLTRAARSCSLRAATAAATGFADR